jgi:katanin p60 ATPase-containing subunit A1
MLRGHEGLVSLAQGVVHWDPPEASLQETKDASFDRENQRYGSCEGLLELRTALKEKLRVENGITGAEVMITAGANQAFVNIVLAGLDEGDAVVLFKPFYFNHMMALQMTGSAGGVELGPTDHGLPDLAWLEKRLGEGGVRMVVIVNPGNPTGVMIPQEQIARLSDLCAQAKTWLVVDNTYEYFAYDIQHTSVSGDHVFNIFSFSKAYGMMGSRVGYFAYPPRLQEELLKIQDTLVICPSIAAQRIAYRAMLAGGDWVRERVRGLDENRQTVRRAVVDSLGEDAITGGSGAIYFMVRLPVEDDVAAVKWLASKHKVCVIPGSACGTPGWVRVSYANLAPSACVNAAERLRAGLTELAFGVDLADVPKAGSGEADHTL